MLLLYIIALLVHSVFSNTSCQDGVEIVPKETKNPGDLIGNWSYVYHWDSRNEFNKKFVDNKFDHLMDCAGISIAAVTTDYAQAKKVECAESEVPFNWSDAKLRLDGPLMNINGKILFMGQIENWLMIDCKKVIRVLIKKVSDDYMLMVNPDVGVNSELIARKVPSSEELKCVVDNIDLGKGMSGIGRCR